VAQLCARGNFAVPQGNSPLRVTGRRRRGNQAAGQLQQRSHFHGVLEPARFEPVNRIAHCISGFDAVDGSSIGT